MNFLPLFQLTNPHHHNPSTSPSTIDSPVTLNPSIQQLLCKPYPISIITALVHSDVGRRFVRAILLQCNDQMSKPEEDGVVMYEKVQVGYTAEGDPFNWLFCEADFNHCNWMLDMMANISCTLILEPTGMETDRIFVQKVTNSFKQITNRPPLIYSLVNQSQNVPNSPYDQLVIPSDWLQASTQTIQSALQQGRKIIANSFTLQNKGKPIPCAVLPLYFTKWHQQTSQAEVTNPQHIWNSAIKSLQKWTQQKCLEEYRTRMAKLYEDKKFISMKLLKNSHEMSMEMAMKSVEKYQRSEGMVEKLQELIDQQLNRIMEEVMEINEKWGRSFVETEFIQIQNRLNNKQLKLISSLKHEFNLFTEYFHKKAQPLGCKKLEYFFVNFITEKAFDFASSILESDKKNSQMELSNMKNKLAQKENQLKQARRQISKQNSQAIKAIQNLQQSIVYHKNRSQLLESTISQLKCERELIQSDHDSKIEELEKSFLVEFNQHKEQKYTLAEELAAAKRRITVLESEISKEKEMHKQANDHYKMMVNEFRIKEEELKTEIQEVTARANQQLQTYKRDTERSLNQSSVTKSQKQKQGIKLAQELTQLSKKYSQLQKAYSNVEYQMQLNKAEQQIVKNDMEIALKIAEQKVCQYQSRLPRYKKFQQQVESFQKLREQHSLQQKQSQKQTALLKQQSTFIWEQMKQVQQKYEAEKHNSRQLKAQLEQLQEKVGSLDKVKVNQWVQTEFDGKFKNMLEQALKMVAVLEVQYGKVKMENTRLRYKLNQY